MNVGRNDPCPCGSGRKYKKCCMNLGSHDDPNRYAKAVYQTSIDTGLSTAAAAALERIMDYMIQTNLVGACHSISCVIFIALTELGYAPQLHIGEVLTNDGIPFDHSWVEFDGKAIDLAVWKNMQGNKTCNPIVMNIDVITRTPHDLHYGIHFKGLDTAALYAQHLSVTEYMNSYPNDRDFLWSLVTVSLNKTIDIDALREKYKSSHRTYTVRPIDKPVNELSQHSRR